MNNVRFTDNDLHWLVPAYILVDIAMRHGKLQLPSTPLLSTMLRTVYTYWRKLGLTLWLPVNAIDILPYTDDIPDRYVYLDKVLQLRQCNDTTYLSTKYYLLEYTPTKDLQEAVKYLYRSITNIAYPFEKGFVIIYPRHKGGYDNGE